ncbi:unnamed protein product, partial [Effrenium voratum]
AEGKNAIGYIDDGTDVEVASHWVECSWEGAGPMKHGFVQAVRLVENDVSLKGPTEDCEAALQLLEEKLEMKIEIFSLGGWKPKAKAKAKAKGKAKAKAKAK